MKRWHLIIVLWAGWRSVGCYGDDSANASCEENTSLQYIVRLQSYWAGNCYLNQPSYRRFSAAMRDSLKVTTDYTQRTANAIEAASIVIDLTDDLYPSTGAGAKLPATLVGYARDAAQELRRWEPKSAFKADAEHWAQPVWTPDAPGNETWREIKRNLRDSGCYTVDFSESCESRYQNALQASGILFAMRDVDQYYRETASDDWLRERERNVQRWDSYLNDMQFQYPWELALNYCYDNPRLRARPGDFNRLQCFVPVWGSVAIRRHLQKWPDKGFVSPPDRRWIFLHPEVGLTYASDEESGSRFVPSLTFQWLGRFFNQYNRKTGRIEKPWGISLVSVVADLPDSDNHGLGVVGHYRNWSLAVTEHGGDAVFTLNLNLLELIQGGDVGQIDVFKGLYAPIAPAN